MNSIEQQREHFDKIASLYYESRRNKNHLLLKHLIWLNFFKNFKHDIRANIKVLEPMCGMAEGLDIVRKYVQKNIDYYGFDYSEEMVKIAKRNYPEGEIEVADVTSYNFGGSKYDLIVLIGGLHHVFSNAPLVVKRLSTGLKKNGHFLNFEPTQNNWLTRAVRKRIYRNNPLFDEETEQGFDLGNLDLMFVDAGFEKVEQAYPGLLAYILYYNPDAFPKLNLGGNWMVKTIFLFDSLFYKSWIGKKLSFATITLWRLR